MHRKLGIGGVTGALVLTALGAVGCVTAADFEAPPEFPREANSLFPEAPSPFSETAEPWHLGAGAVTGVGPEQPVEFPHYTHVTTLDMQCEYCHQSARKSIHGGVPSTKVCAGCHWQVKKDSEKIQTLMSFGEGCNFVAPGMPTDDCEPVPWKKVHDLPDFVHFSHKRHVQGGVQCTECHGQVGLQGQTTTWTETSEDGEKVEVTGVKHVMVRETTMQMGWCLDCHASHPSIDKNYGEKADLRRAELKDCWTCHK